MDERTATPPPEDPSAVVDVVRRASRFSREFLATMIALVTTAFGVVVATLAGAETSQAGLALLVSASVMLVVLGWIPGTAKKAWSAPRAEL